MLMNTDIAPIKKASKSVIDVIVIATSHFISINCILITPVAGGGGGSGGSYEPPFEKKKKFKI